MLEAHAESITSLREEKTSLEAEKQNLLLRLSKLEGANLTHNNPNIADLSNEKRPTKLSEEFSELYDNEWTDAFEDVNIEDDKEKTTYMVKLLQRANELCHEVSREHFDSIKGSFSTITLKATFRPKPVMETLNGQINNNESEIAETDTEAVTQKEADAVLEDISDIKSDSDEMEKNEESNKAKVCETAQNVENQDNIIVIQSRKQDNGTPTGEKTTVTDALDDTDLTQEIAKGVENADRGGQEMDAVHIQIKRDELDFESLTNEQKKTISDARKFFELKLSKEVEMAGTDLIVEEHEIDEEKQKSIKLYIQKCVNLCWSMCRHEPAVHVEFIDINGDVRFDSNKYKPYTKTGKHLDFIVWPTLYLHKDGPMLSKGVAQGK